MLAVCIVLLGCGRERMREIILHGGQVVTRRSVRPADIIIAGERIQAIELPRRRATGRVIDARGCYILPGFIDVHAHGAQLFEFTGGYFRPRTQDFDEGDDAWRRGLPAYAAFLARTGVTSACVATWAASVETLARVLGFLREYLNSGRNGRDGARFLGGNLEGTFINPRMCGAQNPRFILPPEPRTLDAINRAGVLRMANIVPDAGEAAFHLIEHAVTRGIVPGFGHTDATATQVCEGVQRGLRYCVHFLNGPIGGSYKPFDGGGAVEGVLATRDLYVELILDLCHVSPAYVRAVIARKGSDRIMAVTDQMFATGATGVSAFTLGGIRGVISDDGRYVRVAGAPAGVTPNKRLTLFSSVLTMDVAFGNLLSLLTRRVAGVWTPWHPAMPFRRALTAAARMCATNAATMLGLGGETGSIARGKRADLLVGRITGRPGKYRLHVKRVYVAGREVTAPDGVP